MIDAPLKRNTSLSTSLVSAMRLSHNEICSRAREQQADEDITGVRVLRISCNALASADSSCLFHICDRDEVSIFFVTPSDCTGHDERFSASSVRICDRTIAPYQIKMDVRSLRDGNVGLGLSVPIGE